MLPDANLSPPWRPGRRSPAWLLKRPLTWLVIGELIVMVALFALAWHLVQARQARQAPPPATAMRPLPAPKAPPASGVPSAVVQPTPRTTAGPGLATDVPSWIAQLQIINRDQAAWQKAEWKLLQAAVRAIRDYIESVVLPAIKRAEEPPLNSS